MRYVVLVREPLPADMTKAALRLADGFDLSSERAMRLLRRAPGPLTRPVAEREARTVAAVLHGAGLSVEVREESVDGPVMAWDLDALAPAEPGVDVAEPALRATDPAVARPERRTDPAVRATDPAARATDPAARATDPAVRATDPAATGSGRDPKKTYVPGATVTAPPRDPMKTTLERDPPRLERGGLRRRVASAATLPAFLTLLMTMLALVVTLLPLLRAQEARRAAGVAHAVAATVEGLAGGLPLSAPIMRAQIREVAQRTAVRLPGQAVDYLLVLDGEGTPLVAWYRGQLGEERFPAHVRAALERRALEPDGVVTAAGWADSLRATGNDLLALVGLAEEEPVVAAAPITRAGADAGLVLTGSEEGAVRSDVGRALLTALLVGLIPVLFGVLAALSLTRGLREAIGYLLRATDRISHGDFEQPVRLKRDDELGQIATAVERMRISLREAMERLRRR